MTTLRAISAQSGDYTHDQIGGISSDDHHTKTTSAADLTDVSPDSTADAHHSKTTSASELTDVSADSVSDAHHTRPSAGDGLSESTNTFTVNESQVDHDSLSGYVASEHVDHSGVSVNAGTALSGGGDLTSSRTLGVAGPLTGIPFKTAGDDLEWQADANNDLILQNTTDGQKLLTIDQDTGDLIAEGDVSAFGSSSGSDGGGTTFAAGYGLEFSSRTDPQSLDVQAGSFLSATESSLDVQAGQMGWGDLGIAQTDVSKSDVGLGSVPNTDIQYSSPIPADDFTSTEVSNLRSGKLDNGNEPWTNNNYYDDGDARSAVSANDVGLGNVPNTDIAYASTIAADAFTSTEVSNLRSGALNDGSTPWTSNNFYDDSDARSAINGDPDHGSTAQHDYFTDADAVDAVNDEASLSVDITGDADTVDGYEGSEVAVLAEAETVTGLWKWETEIRYESPDDGNRHQAFHIAAHNDDVDLLRVGAENSLFDTSQNFGFSLRYLGTKSGEQNALAIYADNEDDGPEVNALHVLQNGNIGLSGETNPSYALDVAGQVRGQDGLRVSTSSGDYEIQGDGNGNLEILTPAGNRQVLFNDGDIGAFQ